MSFLEGLLWLSLNIYHEARSEPEIGKLAVAHVTLNRAVEKHKSVEQVVTAPYQFSWTFQLDSYLPTNRVALADSARIALKAMTTDDFTEGATFYHHIDVHPSWAGEMIFVKQYGSHRFYRDE
ncbi:MAG: cell wall hydrolase [Desulfobulbus propionicus]|nr:MAG: cell wall hydrolase [Desulfobulbus propionicus]